MKPKFSGGAEGGGLTDEQIKSLDVLLLCVDYGLRLLSPFMPYLTEELWQRLTRRKKETIPSICVAPYPKHEDLKSFEDEGLEREVTFMNTFIKAIRVARAAYEIPNKVKTEAFVVVGTGEEDGKVLREEQLTLCALSYSKVINVVDDKEKVPRGCVTAVVSDKCTAYILLKGLIDLGKEEARLSKKISFNEQQIGKLREAMSKEDYEEKVPEDVQEKNKEKLKGLEGEMEELAKALEGVKLMITEN